MESQDETLRHLMIRKKAAPTFHRVRNRRLNHEANGADLRKASVYFRSSRESKLSEVLEMAESDVVRRAKEDAEKGKAPSTQAGEFVREEIEHVCEGIHGARNIKQTIAIGLSKARRAGVKLPLPKRGTVSAKIRRQAERDSRKGAGRKHTRP